VTAGATVEIHFADFFEVDPATIDEHGAFNVSLINDLPLFIDPFLLFNSDRADYRALHDSMIGYLRFLRDKSLKGGIREGLLRAWFTFPEVKQNWLGYSQEGNAGSGLGMDFARALSDNLNSVFTDFGSEQITKGSHLEKLCLIETGVGRDNISDFTTNLIKEYLLGYTQTYAQRYLPPELKRAVLVPKVRFNYATETWEAIRFELPYHPFHNDYVILTPKDILTKDETWISRPDLFDRFENIIDSLPNDQLRDQVNNYFLRVLPEKPKEEERLRAVARAIRAFPEVIEYYIRERENHGEEAEAQSSIRVRMTEAQFVKELRQFVSLLSTVTAFYQIPGRTYAEAKRRVLFLKDVIENKGGHRIFYGPSGPIRSETDLHILFRLTWYGTVSDVSREVNDGRGPADFKISRGAFDKAIVEFKLASNRKLKQNLQKQVDVYKKASDAGSSLSVIVYFSEGELSRVERILRELGLAGSPHVLLIDARVDNKPAGSYA
jgi:hypothetical protein